MHLLMPHEGTTVSPTSVHDALQALSQTAADEVEVSVPKVNFTSSVSLLDVVTDMGAPEGLAEGGLLRIRFLCRYWTCVESPAVRPTGPSDH